jgi:hypothetical protein
VKTILSEQGLLLPKEELERFGEVVLEERDEQIVIRPKELHETWAGPPTTAGRVQVHVTADVNITAPIARRLVNVELMKKVGQMIMAGEPELLVDGQRVYWKVPFLVVPPLGDPHTYPTGTYALVDARSGLYGMGEREIEVLKAAALPILDRLYPEPEEGLVD